MRSVAMIAVLVAGGVASAAPPHLTGSLRVGVGSTRYVDPDDPAPEGHPVVLDLEVGWRVHPRVSVVGFADYTRFSDDFGDPFRPEVSYRNHQRDLDLGVRTYVHAARVFGGVGLAAMLHRSQTDGWGSSTARGALVQLIAGVDLVRRSDLAFGVAAHAGRAWLDDDRRLQQLGLCLHARWR